MKIMLKLLIFLKFLSNSLSVKVLGKEKSLTSDNPVNLWTPECVEKCFYCHGQVCGDYIQHCCEVGKCKLSMKEGQTCKYKYRMDIKGCTEFKAALRCANPFVTGNDYDPSMEEEEAPKNQTNNSNNCTNNTNSSNSSNSSNSTNSTSAEEKEEPTAAEKEKDKLPCVFEKYGAKVKNPVPDEIPEIPEGNADPSKEKPPDNPKPKVLSYYELKMKLRNRK